MLYWIGVIAIPVLGYSPWHLLWWYPVAFLGAFVAAGITRLITGGGPPPD